MKKLRIVLIIAAIIIITAELAFIMDYSNLFATKNLGSFLVILGMALTIISITVSIKKTKRKNSN